MKIRIKGNFVRYRLSQTEVSTLASGGALLEETCFGPAPGQTFSYALETKPDIPHLLANFSDGRITMYLPEVAAKNWPNEDRIGFEQSIVVKAGMTLQLLLEKDFVCLDETAEDQSDNYPNPLYGKRN